MLFTCALCCRYRRKYSGRARRRSWSPGRNISLMMIPEAWMTLIHEPDRISDPWGQRTSHRFSAGRSSQWSCGKAPTPGQAWSAASKACAPGEETIEMRNRKDENDKRRIVKPHRLLKVERRLYCKVNCSPQCNQIGLRRVDNWAWRSKRSCWSELRSTRS